jgi:signal transduction histidine kinase
MADATVDAVREALTNVRKHARVGVAVLHVSVQADSLTISIVDQGTGFDPTRDHHGTGLRRSIVKQIHHLGGSARIDSTPGDGTSVELRIPCAATAVYDTRMADASGSLVRRQAVRRGV